MKSLITALTMTVLIAGVGAANAADRQATGAEMDYALSQEVAAPSAHASARIQQRPVQAQEDFQLEGR